jgi:hypothetical protein
VASGLPALALALVFGSPPVDTVAATALVVLAWGGLAAGLGLAASSLTRSVAAGVAGALVASATLLALTIGVPTVASAIGATLPVIAFRLNPLAAVLLAEPETGRRIAELASGSPFAAAFATGATPPGPAWWPFVVAAAAVCALLAGATSLIVGRSTSDA